MKPSRPNTISVNLVVLIATMVLFGLVRMVVAEDTNWRPSASNIQAEERTVIGTSKKKLDIKIGPPMTGKWIAFPDAPGTESMIKRTVPSFDEAVTDAPTIAIGSELSLDISEWMELKIGVDFSSDLYDEQIIGVAGMNINF